MDKTGLTPDKMKSIDVSTINDEVLSKNLYLKDKDNDAYSQHFNDGVVYEVKTTFYAKQDTTILPLGFTSNTIKTVREIINVYEMDPDCIIKHEFETMSHGSIENGSISKKGKVINKNHYWTIYETQ